MNANYKNLTKIIFGSLMAFFVAACVATPKPQDPDQGGDNHDKTDHNRLADYRITITNKGDVVVLDENGEHIKPNAKLPLEVEAHYIEEVETVTIVRYRGSPEYDIVTIGQRVWVVPVNHTH